MESYRIVLLFLLVSIKEKTSQNNSLLHRPVLTDLIALDKEILA